MKKTNYISNTKQLKKNQDPIFQFHPGISYSTMEEILISREYKKVFYNEYNNKSNLYGQEALFYHQTGVVSYIVTNSEIVSSCLVHFTTEQLKRPITSEEKNILQQLLILNDKYKAHHDVLLLNDELSHFYMFQALFTFKKQATRIHPFLNPVEQQLYDDQIKRKLIFKKIQASKELTQYYKPHKNQIKYR